MLKQFEPLPLKYNDVDIKLDVPAFMRDGTTLYADVYSPGTSDKLPVLLMRTPYDKRTAQSCVFQDPTWYARNGYMVVVQDCRGRYASEGTWYPYKNESADGFDTIDWCSKLNGSNGDVGMFGFSYAGAAQLLAASQKPPALKTIVPALTASDFFNGWTYEGGALSQAFIQSWSIGLAQNTALKAGDRNAARVLAQLFGQVQQFFWSSPLSAIPDALLKYAPYYKEWLEHEAYDEYWKQIAIRERYDEIMIPILHIGGWYDVFISGTIKNFVELNRKTKEESEKPQRGKQKLIIGPWYHLPWQSQFGSVDFGDEAGNIVDAAQLKWFNQILKHEEVSVDKPDHNASIFILNANKWQTTAEWPPRYATPTMFYLHSNGSANSLSGDGKLSKDPPTDEPWDSYIYDPASPVPSLGGHSCCVDFISPMGPRDQRPNQFRNDVLVYTTEPLASDMTIMGQVIAKIHASSTAIDTDFTVTLSDVYECGKAINLANGIIRASRRDSLIHPRDMEPGTVYEFTIKVGWTAALITKGHRIRMEISSSNFPHYSINTNTGTPVKDAELLDAIPARQTIFHDSQHLSHILLPLCP